MIKTIAVIEYKTDLFDFHLLDSFTTVIQFLINLSFWLYMKKVVKVATCTDSYHWFA